MMKKLFMVFIFGIFYIFSTNLFADYDLIISKSNFSARTYYRGVQDKKVVEKMLKNYDKVSLKIDSGLTLRDKKILTEIELTRQSVEIALKVIRQSISIYNFKKSTGESIEKDEKVKFKIIEFATPFVIDELKKNGIKFENEGLNSIIEISTGIILKSIDYTLNGADALKTGPLFWVDKVLELAQIGNNVFAIQEVGDYLLYSFNQQISDAYIKYFIKQLFLNETIQSIEEFMKSRYVYKDNILTKHEFIAQTSKYPSNYETLEQYVKKLNVIVTPDDMEHFFSRFDKILVGSWIDLYNIFKRKSNYRNVLQKLTPLVKLKLSEIGLSRWVIKFSINDSLFYDYRKILTGERLYISDLSDFNYVFLDINNIINNGQKYFSSKSVDVKLYCEPKELDFDYIEFRLEKGVNNVFSKKSFNEKCNKDIVHLSFIIDKKDYSLNTDIRLYNRHKYIREHSYLYDKILKLRLKDIVYAYNNDYEYLSSMTKVKKRLLFSTLYSFFGHTTINNETDEREQNFHRIFKYATTDSHGYLTYREFFNEIKLLLVAQYGKNFYYENGEIIFPSKNANIHNRRHMSILRMQAKKKNFKDYAEIKYLSDAGIIRTDIKKVMSHMDEIISSTDYIKYIYRLLEFTNKKDR